MLEFNLIKAYPRHNVFFDWQILRLTMDSLLRGKYFDQSKIFEFERTFAAYVGTKEAISVPSGRIGLYLILRAFQYPPGSEIILSDYNFRPIVSVIVANGLRPVFVDIDPLTFNIGVKKIEEKISPNTKAILVTHLFGNPCEMDTIIRIAKQYRLNVIEDGAHAFGSKWRSQPIGSLGDAAFFSLSIGKNIVAYEGGVITSSNEMLLAKIRNDLQFFSKPSFYNLLKKVLKIATIYTLTKRPLFCLFPYPLLRSFNYTLFDIIDRQSREKTFLKPKHSLQKSFSGLQAYVGLYQISRINDYKNKKKKIIQYLDEKLKNIKLVEIQYTLPEAENYKLYYIICLKEKPKKAILDIRYRLLDRGVDTQIPDMDACSLFKEFKEYTCSCPNAVAIASRVFEIPSDISLNSKDLNWIVKAVEQSVK